MERSKGRHHHPPTCLLREMFCLSLFGINERWARLRDRGLMVLVASVWCWWVSFKVIGRRSPRRYLEYDIIITYHRYVSTYVHTSCSQVQRRSISRSRQKKYQRWAQQAYFGYETFLLDLTNSSTILPLEISSTIPWDKSHTNSPVYWI